MNVSEHNRRAWNRESRDGSPWATPVGPARIRAARSGDWSVILTPTRPVPRAWLGDLRDRDVLCLASGGGQLAAGFVITDLYEDGWTDEATPLNRFSPVAIATRALKLGAALASKAERLDGATEVVGPAPKPIG